MVNIARWKIITVFAICIFGLFSALPNVLSESTRAKLPGWLPHKTVNLGLDLQGGSHLQLQVEVDKVIKDRTDSLVQSVRPELRKAKIGYTRIAPINNGIRITLREDQEPAPVQKILRTLDAGMNIKSGDEKNTIEATLDDMAIKKIHSQTIDQSIEIVRRRVDETGTREPVIQRQGEDRIIVQLPGVDNPERIKEILGKTAQLSFHLVSDGASAGETRSLPLVESPGQTIDINRRPLITGDMLTNAQPSFQDGMAVVTFSLNTIGAKRFCDVTRENIGKPFAIVLDNQVISAPRINSAICGGNAIITGQFDVQQTADLALLLRAGALPAPLTIMEERTVGPSLGADSIEAGKKACIMALIFVTIMSICVYGLFGIFASVGLMVNMVLIMAIMSMLQATLTLPGIAGIVLTIGLAVDANVLIFERVKEELRAGRSIFSALDAGYTRARTTIIDSNLTALISALILYSLGSGPIKGFAVTMCIGVVTSYFCAMMLTRIIVLAWVRWAKPKTIDA